MNIKQNNQLLNKKIKDVAIGSTACRQCENNIYTNLHQNWVDCVTFDTVINADNE